MAPGARMKIAWIVAGGVDESGVERVVPSLLWLIERLARRYELHVFALRQYPQARDYPLLGAHIHCVAAAVAPMTWLSIERGLQQHGPFDLVHTVWAGLNALIAGVYGRRHGRPVLVSLFGGELVAHRDVDYGTQLRWSGRATIAASLGLASRLTVQTGFMQQLAAQRGYQAEVVPFGVPTDFFSPGPPTPPARDRGMRRLLHVGSLNQVKDHRTLLRAMAAIVRERTDVHLDLIGEDTLHGAIHREVEALGLTPFVTFAGWQPSSAMPAFYRRADLLLLSSRHEAGPLVVLEAAACGLPTVGTRVGHVADWAPRLASTVPVGDADALARSTLALLNDEERRQRMASDARAFALTYDADWTADRFDGLYREMVRGGRR
jgi:glycosyltransferase involved in cell wall biosynthesis